MFYVSCQQMQEWKQVVATISVIVLLASMVLYLVMLGPVLDDPEFDAALVWAEQVGMPDLELTREYPFSPITREDAVDRYIVTAQEMEMIVYGDNLCDFDDIDALEQHTKDQIMMFKTRSAQKRSANKAMQNPEKSILDIFNSDDHLGAMRPSILGQLINHIGD